MSVFIKHFTNREISWLSFNERVLQEAEDKQNPPLERLRFLGIFSNNLDEFFRVRVATIKRMSNIGKSAKAYFNMKPKKLLKSIQEIVVGQQERFEKSYVNIQTELEKHHVYFLNEKQLNPKQVEFLQEFYLSKLRPVLSPIMMYNTADFPFLREKSIHLMVKFSKKGKPVSKPYSIIEVPVDALSRFIQLPSEGNKKYFLLLEDVIRFCLPQIYSVFNFSGHDAWTIKLTRDAELDIDNDVSKSIVEKISKSVKQRKKAEPVRLIHDEQLPKDILRFIIQSINLDDEDNIIAGGRYHNFKDFIKFPSLGITGWEFTPIKNVPIRGVNPFSSLLKEIKKRDLLLHFPYHSFNTVIDLLREAALDPDVTSIKMTVYRLAENSNVMNALINAAKNGKVVTVVMELQARFDEENNIKWSTRLQEEGVRVFSGVPGLKVHAKLLLITRNESGKPTHYASIGTGNFNEQTSRVYCDHTLLTSDARLTLEVDKLFHFFENNYRISNFKNLLVSPFSMRKRIVKLIMDEASRAKAGYPASIVLKLNNLVDPEIVERLYEASRAGVKIRLIVRGVCTLIPGVQGMSENIQVISILGRYLEHSRIFLFGLGIERKVFISSADLMTRNLDSRVEVITPVYDKECIRSLVSLLDLQLHDNTKARILDASYSNAYKKVPSQKTRINAQMKWYSQLA